MNIVDDYFKSHSLNPDFISKEFDVTWDEKTIVIPVKNEGGEIMFNRYRHLEGDSKFTNDRGAHTTLFPKNKVKDKEVIVICEGEPDCMRLWQENVPAVTGTTGVKTLDENLFKPLVGKKVYLVLDNDEAGRSSIISYIITLNKIGIKPLVIELPDPYKDVCEYLTLETNPNFLNLMSSALTQVQWMQKNKPEFQTITAEELASKDFPEEQWIIDKIIPKEGVSFWFGDSGTGKSLISLSLAKSIVTGEKWLDTFDVLSKQKVLFIDKEHTLRTQSDRL